MLLVQQQMVHKALVFIAFSLIYHVDFIAEYNFSFSGFLFLLIFLLTILWSLTISHKAASKMQFNQVILYL